MFSKELVFIKVEVCLLNRNTLSTVFSKQHSILRAPLLKAIYPNDSMITKILKAITPLSHEKKKF